ncbi:MAG: hypothetical protein K2G16_04050, partial [Lachnospiraceae bacterium]|nr:hypothetical protein [Lachnospiraceae bacterium]
MEKVLNFYYENNAKRLHNVVNQIFYRKYGGIAGKDMDEFYSTANDVFADIIKNCRYDAAKGDFEGFLYRALELAIADEFKRQNCDKRKIKQELLDEAGSPLLDKNGKPRQISLPDIYIDAPIGEGTDLTIGDMLPSDFNMETVLERDEISDERVEAYLKRLSRIQRRIMEMRLDKVPVSEIQKKLKLSDKQYKQHFRELRSFANISVLQGRDKLPETEEKEMSKATQTMESCKTDRISVASIIKRIDRHTIRFDHPLQRESDQWSPAMKGNLVSDILQGNKLHPLIFAEQIINGVPIIWDLDGKQRCTNAYLFFKNGYKVSKNIRRPLITYQTVKRDKKGKEVLDANGFPIAVNVEFDIRGKRFDDLPEELRDRFLEYSFNYDQYLNCSEEDIGYHIERYNDGKPMTSPQKGITRLGTEYAERVKSISNMPFFKDIGGYKVSEFRNGTVNRVVVESIMAANYLDKWNKLEDMCQYMKEHGSRSVFEEFEDMVERMEKAVGSKVADMFDSKDSFLWFGLFARFIKTGEEDKRFVAFMAEFARSLHEKRINGVSFDGIIE